MINFLFLMEIKLKEIKEQQSSKRKTMWVKKKYSK